MPGDAARQLLRSRSMCRMLLTALLLWPLVPRCGGSAPGPMQEALALHFIFPQELAPQTKRYRRLLARVRYLELLLTPGGGPPVRHLHPPGEWNAVALLPVPAGAREGVTVQARIWDHDAEGQPRAFPILVTPVRKIAAAELQRGEPVPVHLRFSLQVPARELE